MEQGKRDVELAFIGANLPNQLIRIKFASRRRDQIASVSDFRSFVEQLDVNQSPFGSNS